MNDIITILLATYNGEKYIGQQLDSIVNQTCTNWRIIIRDDNSTDNTRAIIHEYKKQYPDQITVLENSGKNSGSLLNFSTLLQAAGDAGYIMFCDQDDVWTKDKIEKTFFKMQALEQQCGADYPLLIFTNFQYVDNDLKVIESKKNFEINRIKSFGFPHLLAHNPVYGCTTMINKALADKVGIIPPQADFHDHWIALIASAFGKLFYLKEKTVLYRQHGSNVSGNWDNNSFKKRFRRILIDKKNVAEVKAKYKMLLTFKKMYAANLREPHRQLLNVFLCFYKQKNLLCLFKSIRSGIRSQTILQSFLLYTTILFTRELQ